MADGAEQQRAGQEQAGQEQAGQQGGAGERHAVTPPAGHAPRSVSPGVSSDASPGTSSGASPGSGWSSGWGSGWSFGLGGLADDLIDSVERLRTDAGSAFESTVSVGVTGLAGAGKTVFVTALAAALLDRARLRRLPGAERIRAAVLRPQPDPAVPRFALEAHLDTLRADPPAWPRSTRSVSQLRIALRLAPSGIAGTIAEHVAGISGYNTLNLDITDYPGEWLLDLPLIETDYETWAATALADAARPARAGAATGWAAALAAVDPAGAHGEPAAEALAAAWTGYLQACRQAGFSTLAPGRFLMPGEFEGSPALAFAPLPRPDTVRGRAPGSLWAEMRRRYDAYRANVVKPFFRRHFTRLDRQVVLVDPLAALERGPAALADMTEALGAVMASFRHGRSGWLDRLMGARRIARVLVAATKADRLHHTQHDAHARLIEAMLADATRQASFDGAEVRAMAIASLRATAEHEQMTPDGPLAMVRGIPKDGARETALHPGALPEDPAAFLAAARAGETPDWPDGARFRSLDFRPPRWGAGPPPHIRLDSALDFLIGDRLG
ncbi:MAG: YcjX family protein [Pseudomonadota bacterium]